MFKHLLILERKAFFRSASFRKSLALKVLMAFLALYLITIFLALGFGIFSIIKKVMPESDPFMVFNSYLLYWFLADLVIRFFFQKLPVMSVKPLLLLRIKRSHVVNYVLCKSVLSYFNFLPLFAVIPFTITLISNDYPVNSTLVWALAFLILTVIVNFLNFIIESLSAKTELSFLPIIAIVGGLSALNYFEIIAFGDMFSYAIIAISNHPVLLIVLVAILIGLYVVNFKLLRAQLFLDHGLKEKVKSVEAANLDWTKNFGDIAPFMQLDLKLLWRNKRSKSSVWMLGLGLLYGLFFYPNPTYQNMTSFYIFIGIFTTGIFLINFGQFIPAWDGEYYRLLMSQNIKYEKYLQSKFTLMALSVVVLFVLGIPYVYFGWKILLAHFAAAIYNIGVNTHVMLYGGAFNRKKIDLNQKAAFNMQGTGMVQWLIGIPLLLLPMGLFALLKVFIGFEFSCLVLFVLGSLGIVFHNKFMKVITSKYLKSKYKMIDAFSQNS